MELQESTAKYIIIVEKNKSYEYKQRENFLTGKA